MVLALALIATLLIIGIFHRLILRLVFRRVEDARIRYQWRKTLSYVASFIAILLVGRVWFKGFQSLTTFLGLLTAGVAIAHRDLMSNLAG